MEWFDDANMASLQGMFFLISAFQESRHHASLDASLLQKLHTPKASHQKAPPFQQNHMYQSPLSFPPGKQGFRCPKCGMQYFIHAVFERHVAKCDGNNPLVCRICKRVFSQACATREHLRGFHGIGEKVSCQFCGKDFKYKTSLYTHFCEEKQKQQLIEKERLLNDQQ